MKTTEINNVIIQENEQSVLINFDGFAYYDLFILGRYKIINLNKSDRINKSLIWVERNKIKDLIEFLEENKHFNINNFKDKIENYINNDTSLLKLKKAQDIKEELMKNNVLLSTEFKEEFQLFEKNLREKIKPYIFNNENIKNTKKQMYNVFQSTILENSANFSEPGSGKTLMSIMTHYERERQINKDLRIVIVCPIVAFNVWKDEILNFTNIENDKIHIIHPNHNEENEKEQDDFDYKSSGQKIIMLNYEKLKKFINNNTKRKNLFSTNTHLIIDEIHRIKNPEGQRSNFMKKITEEKGIKFLTILTGTPTSNNINEFVNILKIAWRNNIPNLTNDLIEEIDNIFDSVKRNENLNEEDKNQLKKFNDQIFPLYILLRKKEDFGIADPNDTFMNPFSTEPTKEQKAKDIELYDSLIQRINIVKSKNKGKKIINKNKELEEIFGILSELRQNSSGFYKIKNLEKIEKLFELISKIINENEKVIIWFEFIESMNFFCKYLEKRGIKSKIINSNTEYQERLETLNKFKNNFDNSFNVLITSAASIGESISLHKAVKNAIFVELTNSYYQWIQAKDRIHRVGIKDGSEVNYYYLKTNFLHSDKLVWKNLSYKIKINKITFQKEKGNLINLDNIKNENTNLIENHDPQYDSESIFLEELN